MKELNGRVAVVTGAASGIGRATSEAFAAEGMKVVLADVEEPRLVETAGALRESGADVIEVIADVSDESAMQALAERALEAFGAVHVVHLNAGVATGGPSWTLTDNDWRWVLGVNLWGVIHGIRAFVPILLEQEEAHVVNTASMAGIVTAPFMAPYNVSKHGVVALSETLQKELQMFGGGQVGVSVLCPGWVNTGIGDSSRNRPDTFRNPETGGGDLADLGGGAVKGLLEAGLAPAEVAARVVDAIKTDRFYIFTHTDWMEMAKTRFEDILGERSPTGGFLPS